MKRQYINPTMEVIKMETMSVLADSLTFGSGDMVSSAAQGRDYDYDDWDE